MSTQAAEAVPAQRLFQPPIAIPFQLRTIAEFYLRGHGMGVWDTGVGKTALAIGLAAVAMERGVADHILIFCEVNKLTDWKGEFAKFSLIPAEDIAVYHGPKRRKLLEDLPPVLITTYETARQDAVIFESTRKYTDGPLIDALRGRRVVVAYDEISKLGNRSSKLYKAHFRMLERLRRQQPDLRVIGLTGTPMEGGGYEQFFNEMRITSYPVMPKVTEFEKRCIRYWHPMTRRPVYNPQGVEWFRQLCQPYISRKRKSDPEVRDFFPPFTERFETVTMRADQRGIYQRLEDLAWDKDRNFRQVPGLSHLLYQLAGDPMALKWAAERGNSELARMAWRVLGAELEACSSAKAEYLQKTHLEPILAAGNKVIVFTFFGRTVLQALQDRLEAVETPLYAYHGGMTRGTRDQALASFQRHRGGAVLLASDAASKGLNIPEASYTIEYEVARTHATRTQRAGRGHRLGKEDPLTFISLALEDTVETAKAVPKLLDRNAEQDYMLGDEGAEGYTTADDRWEMFAQARKRKAPK